MLGDLGLYIPIVVLLALARSGSTLIMGLCNILQVLCSSAVMALHEVDCVALVENLTEGEIVAAGITTWASSCFLG